MHGKSVLMCRLFVSTTRNLLHYGNKAPNLQSYTHKSMEEVYTIAHWRLLLKFRNLPPYGTEKIRLQWLQPRGRYENLLRVLRLAYRLWVILSWRDSFTAVLLATWRCASAGGCPLALAAISRRMLIALSYLLDQLLTIIPVLRPQLARLVPYYCELSSGRGGAGILAPPSNRWTCPSPNKLVVLHSWPRKGAIVLQIWLCPFAHAKSIDLWRSEGASRQT